MPVLNDDGGGHAGALRHPHKDRALLVGDHDFGSRASNLCHALLDHKSGVSPNDFVSKGLANYS